MGSNQSSIEIQDTEITGTGVLLTASPSGVKLKESKAQNLLVINAAGMTSAERTECFRDASSMITATSGNPLANSHPNKALAAPPGYMLVQAQAQPSSYQY